MGFLVQIIYSKDLNISFSLMEYVYVGIIYVLSYIFEYGYEIQLDSNAKMYGDELEG